MQVQRNSNCLISRQLLSNRLNLNLKQSILYLRSAQDEKYACCLHSGVWKQPNQQLCAKQAAGIAQEASDDSSPENVRNSSGMVTSSLQSLEHDKDGMLRVLALAFVHSFATSGVLLRSFFCTFSWASLPIQTVMPDRRLVPCKAKRF